MIRFQKARVGNDNIYVALFELLGCNNRLRGYGQQLLSEQEIQHKTSQHGLSVVHKNYACNAAEALSKDQIQMGAESVMELLKDE